MTRYLLTALVTCGLWFGAENTASAQVRVGYGGVYAQPFPAYPFPINNYGVYSYYNPWTGLKTYNSFSVVNTPWGYSQSFRTGYAVLPAGGWWGYNPALWGPSAVNYSVGTPVPVVSPAGVGFGYYGIYGYAR